jgi:hypothetical protein
MSSNRTEPAITSVASPTGLLGKGGNPGATSTPGMGGECFQNFVPQKSVGYRSCSSVAELVTVSSLELILSSCEWLEATGPTLLVLAVNG